MKKNEGIIHVLFLALLTALAITLIALCAMVDKAPSQTVEIAPGVNLPR